VAACTVESGFEPYGNDLLIAPSLMWSEVRSSLHVGVWRGVLSRELAAESLDLLERAPLHARAHPRLGGEAWRIADALGWAKTYDAEYLALATIVGCPLVTLDRRMLRAAARIGIDARPPS
jgi:predicted nucleic acid-binding protein